MQCSAFPTSTTPRWVFDALPERFARFGLKLHPTKTTLLRFKPPRDDEPRGTFDFLGFTHHWGKSQLGRWSIQRKTAKSRMQRALTAFSVVPKAPPPADH
jgi:RNA-directed DNA polymerase